MIAWLWARTVKSPNPAFSHVDVPLASTFILSSKAGKEAWVQPVVEGDSYRFEVRTGKPPESAKAGTTASKRAAFICLMSGVPIDYKYIRAEGAAGRMGQRLMAIVAEGQRGRIYLAPTADQIAIAESAKPVWSPEMDLPNNPRDFKTPNYGLGVAAEHGNGRRYGVIVCCIRKLRRYIRHKIAITNLGKAAFQKIVHISGIIAQRA